MRPLAAALMITIVAGCGVPATSDPTEIPAGTLIELRLRSKVASNESKTNDPVEAVVIAPVLMGGRIAIAPGTLARGAVQEAVPTGADQPRASLRLQFAELVDKDGNKTPIECQAVAVDNARESVDETGRIVGIVPSEALSSRMDEGLSRLSSRLSGLASLLQTMKNTVVKQTDPEIQYGPGVEMTVKLSKPLPQTGPGASFDSYVPPVRPESGVADLVNAQPFQTMAQKPSKPSDITNLMFLGARQDIERAFAQAGWSSAAALGTKAKLETLRAIVEDRGYSEAPVSVLLLEEQQPDIVFEKPNNTFASRHHLRVWKRPGSFDGRDLWVSAATHDTGIDFSPENRTFIHKIESQIDLERTKVVYDLLFTGLVQAYSLVDRPAVPLTGSNATGDKLTTDGKMAILLF